jgi:hypothetical protein
MLRAQVFLGASATIVTAMITGLANPQGTYAAAVMAMRATLTYQMDAKVCNSLFVKKKGPVSLHHQIKEEKKEFQFQHANSTHRSILHICHLHCNRY